ncbi:hypothetical protein [Pseudomonas sp. GZD-222]|uniref:hypothetical protein n=1 Tax=Pseudomonas sp. GZD-222 TaxID=3404805 RepID=UPI003BB50ECD
MEFESQEQQDLFGAIQQALPNFPPDIVYHWLLPFAQDIGWPPGPNDLKFHKETRWSGILRWPIQFWQAVQWELVKADTQTLKFSRESLNGFQDMVSGHAYGRQTLLTIFLGENSKKRFFTQVFSLFSNGTFEQPPVLLKKGEWLDVVDGTHRMSAMVLVMSDPRWRRIHEAKYPSAPLSNAHNFWIGTPPVDALWTHEAE